MNELLANDLGLVLGMAQLHIETCAKAHTAMEEIFGVERRSQIMRDENLHIENITKIAKENGVSDIVFDKSRVSRQTLQLLRDSYVNEKWQDTIVVGEWLSMFESLAMIRWAVILGAIETLAGIEKNIVHDDLLTLTTKVSQFHYGIFHDNLTHFHNTGVKSAKIDTRSGVTEQM